MGRVKLQIKKLESNNARNVTYSKRRAGILKKATELSILCDIDILLFMFSPNGKPTLCLGEHSNLMQMIAKFYHLTPQVREKSKLESLETLKKTFKKLDHDVKIQDFMGSSGQTEEELTNHLQSLKAQLAELEMRLSYWTEPEKAQNIDHILQMEENLRESLNQIQIQKTCFGKQFMPLSNICLGKEYKPLGFSDQWTHGSDEHLLMLPEGASLIQRNLNGSAGIAPHGYSDYFNIEKPESSRREPGNALNDMNQNSSLQLHLGAHNPYQCYDMNFRGENTFKPDGVEQSHVNYPVNFYSQHNSGYDTEIQTLASSSGSRDIMKFDEHLYAQRFGYRRP